MDDTALMRAELERLGNYDEYALKEAKPIFVSRAPQRRNGGAAHKDTIYGQPARLATQGGVTQKVALNALTMKDLDNLIDPHRNEKLYAAIRDRMEAHSGRADKAFTEENPLRKPDKDGNPTRPIVRTVKLVIDKLSGIPVRGVWRRMIRCSGWMCFRRPAISSCSSLRSSHRCRLAFQSDCRFQR